MKDTGMDRPWQARLVVDPVAERAFGLALEPVAQSLSSFENAPGGPWQVDAIFDAVEQFREGRRQDDDITAVVVRITG